MRKEGKLVKHASHNSYFGEKVRTVNLLSCFLLKAAVVILVIGGIFFQLFYFQFVTQFDENTGMEIIGCR